MLNVYPSIVYNWAWAVVFIIYTQAFGDASLTDNSNSSHAFFIYSNAGSGNDGQRYTMMKETVWTALFWCILCTSCSSSKRVAYLQQLGTEQNNVPVEVNARIMPKDLLTISISCSEPEAALPFNLIVPTSQNELNTTNSTSQPILQNYLVNSEGRITLPVLGELKVERMTTQEISDMIAEKLKRYLKEQPIVTVRLVNYKISVIGEVNHPGIYTVNNGQVNLLEAIAMAGDLTIYGKRNNVRIIRKENNRQRLITVNLNDVNVIHSSDFYLHQNDIVYVEPNKAKTQGANIGSSTNLLISITSILISMAGLIVTILR